MKLIMKQVKFKGSFSDLKPALKSLKGIYESAEKMEETHPEKEDMYIKQERDIANIKRVGQSNNE